ncbi:hypothetical protein [Flavobacterium sp.]|uniref:hypothetical protein n=1 Tax=Flavobacterium sp. TaxID=239 RepID=UPI002DAC7755|nr:hypothetical protein [Flavobacterium sp.]
MSKISIIKKIQLGVHGFPIEHPDSELCFNFYCGNGVIKHEASISLEKSNLLVSLIESGTISNTDLAQNDVDTLQNLEDPNRAFTYRYQIYNAKECNNDYLIIFDITEYRDYYTGFIYAALQIEK